MRALIVGDAHAKAGDLEDCRRLADFVHATAVAENVDYVIWLGDQNHTHAILHVDVLGFWKEVFSRPMSYKHVVLVGNHDLPGTGSGWDAMHAFDGIAMVVRRPTVLDGILLMPYYANHEEFVKVVSNYGQFDTVICHQTFDGSKYENGFYAKDGINPNLLPQKLVISGHIHTPQKLGKVWYPGAPRWQTLSDANVNRAIWTVTFDRGEAIGFKDFDTGLVCRRIYHLESTPTNAQLAAAQTVLKDIDVLHVDIVGSEDWTKEASALWAAIPQARVRVFKTDSKPRKIQERHGISNAFATFLKDFKPPHGTSLEVLEKMVAERIKS